MSRKRPKQNKRAGSNTLRIIGGQWRSRKLPFLDAPGLRPTADRIRETLFNWLQGDVHGARCLDLFAGSGALGFEALSRGAGKLVFVEKNKAAANQIIINLDLLKADAEVHLLDALDYLASESGKSEKKGGDGYFDIIFLDPPYRKGLLDKSLKLIQEKKLGDQNSLIYLEHESEESYDWSDYGLCVLKQASAGQVQCYLLGSLTP